MKTLFYRFRRDVQMIGLLTTFVLLTLSLISFSPKDPSWSSQTHFGKASNLCGLFGSYLADSFFQLFGMATWALLPVMIFWIYQFSKKEKQEFVWGVALTVSWLSMLSAALALLSPASAFYEGSIRIGGVAGIMISQGLSAVLNRTGALVLTGGVFGVLTLIQFEINLIETASVLLIQGMREVIAKTKAAALALVKTLYSGIETILKQPRKVEISGDRPQERTDTLFKLNRETIQEAAEKEDSEEDYHPTTQVEFVLDKPVAPKKEKFFDRIQAPRKVENWVLPKLSLLEEASPRSISLDQKQLTRQVKILEDKLAQFSVKGQVVAVKPGPAVTLFEFKPNADVKISRITELADDLALALSSESLRIIAPLPGRDVVGIETANLQRETVYLKECLEHASFWDEKIKIPLVLGKQANGEVRIEDLRRMPHLLVAGTTGSGKSIFVTSGLCGLLFRHSPKTLRMILIDPKQVDLAAFHKIPHLLMPPVRDPKKAVLALKWAVREMEKRYRSMAKFDARQIEEFNKKIEDLPKDKLEEHQLMNESFEKGSPEETYYFEPQPYIVVIVEEFGDLMTVDKQNVETLIVRLAQMARACGIHLALAMQSPRKEVVTGLIKTNIPGRISFKVASKTDSRIILDESGAERLLARGDMLFLAPGVSKPERHHGAWLSEQEMTRLAKFWSEQSEPQFDEKAIKMLEGSRSDTFEALGEADGEDFHNDERYDEILSYVSTQKEVSASLLQRRFKFGYPRAARMIEIFEREGIVGPANGSKPRQVLIGQGGA